MTDSDAPREGSTVADELAGVPELASFLGPAALTERLHDLAGRGAGQVRTIGRSRGGRPIDCLSIGTGERDVIVFGLPHPNEPIGGLTALHLAERLGAGGAFGLGERYRWHIVPCVDPDGLELNAGWLDGPYTLAHYARHFYRPAGAEQVEWAFPFHYKRAAFDHVLPETRALMDLIDRTRPVLMCSLHNSELGGAYFYLSRPEPELHPQLAALPGRFGVDLHLGQPESPVVEVLADGVHLLPGAREEYDYRESLGLDPVAVQAGDASSRYAAQYGTLTLVTELPYWRDHRASDTSPAGVALDEALRRQARDVAEVVELMSRGLAVLARQDIEDSALLRGSEFFAAALASVPASATARAGEQQNHREATVAELSSVQDVSDSFRMRYAGMLRRGLAGLPDHRRPQALLDELSARHEEWLLEAEQRHRGLQTLPLRDLVAIQYGAILQAALHVGGGREAPGSSAGNP